MKLRRTKKGFTIVELVIVIGVIGILSAILIPTFVNLTNQAKERANQLEARDAYTAYVAVAVDGLIDASEAKDLGHSFVNDEDTVAIAYKKQGEVTLKKGDTIYEWDGKNWASFTSAHNATPVASKYDVEGENKDIAAAALSVFNGWTVYYTAA